LARTIARRALLAALGALVGGCTFTRSVVPVARPIDSTVCIEENDEVWSKQFLPALRQEFERRGVRTSGSFPQPVATARRTSRSGDGTWPRTTRPAGTDEAWVANALADEIVAGLLQP
jgi:hypothetical protein